MFNYAKISKICEIRLAINFNLLFLSYSRTPYDQVKGISQQINRL